jgi:arylformamidase
MLYDISPLISEALPVWPGDVAPERVVRADFQRGDSLNLSALRTTVHVGAHVDAPSHIVRGCPNIDQLELDPFVGPAQVVAVHLPRGTAVEPEHLPARIEAPRVLFKTGSFSYAERFDKDFVSLSAAAVDHLHALGVVLVGIDTPSVDLFAATDLPVHHALAAHGMLGLEGLVLADVAEGLYELIALPLRLGGFEASPVRAVLRC